MRASAPLSILCLAALPWAPALLHAGTFTVTKTADTNDGACDADCSIREAVSAANALFGLDTVFVPEGLYTLAIPGANEDAGATGDFDVTDFLIVEGAGDGLTILDGNALDRLFDVQSAASLDLFDLTLRNGEGQGVEGGCLRAAGGLFLTRVFLLDCVSSGLGGGAYVLDVIFEAEYSEFRGNVAVGSGGGFAADFGADVLLRDVRIVGNSATNGSGGGGSCFGCDLEIHDSTFDDNEAPSGGALAAQSGFLTPASLGIFRSTVSRNRATGSGGAGNGGGLGLQDVPTLVENSTFSDNEAGGDGSAIHNEAQGNADAIVELVSSTLEARLSLTAAFFASFSEYRFKSSILSGAICDGDGFFATEGHNLSDDAGGGGCGLDAGREDKLGEDPMLGPLQDNGGPTETRALPAGSPAIDAGDPLAPLVDQRGFGRLNGPDIGAFEFGGVAPVDCMDLDGDGFGDPGAAACPNGPARDCDDADPAIRPGELEICGDDIDQDCDGFDDGSDDDGDGAIDVRCGGGDCDDRDGSIHPGAEELCGNDTDENCDGVKDRADDDGDGSTDVACGGDDCDDADPAVRPGGLEICGDEIDQDCDGFDDGSDDDGDGAIDVRCGGGDCDDRDGGINPNAEEICGDEVDNDCSGAADDLDEDGDGFVSDDCDGDDCNDGDASIHPGAPEICGDGIDQDCGGLDREPDNDGDGHASVPCGGLDCNDDDPAIGPDIQETCDDGIDQDCNGSDEEGDDDGDGFTDVACGGSDCDDEDATVNNLAEEVCDGKDNDCDGGADNVDADGDGARPEECGGDDCDDGNPDIFRGAGEAPGNGVDDDCDGTVDEATIIPDCDAAPPTPGDRPRSRGAMWLLGPPALLILVRLRRAGTVV